ncbi:MAG: hypothetical protein JXA18_11915 [Chitinispirillaceae bacterium]|nr:hypothetical protein [Chitinispirillaceae bacterium]
MHSIGAIILPLCFLAAAATEDTVTSETAKKILLSGAAELETAEMIKARITYSGKSGTLDHVWYSHLIGTLNFTVKPVERLLLRGSFEFRQFMNMSGTQYNPAYNNSYNLGDFLNEEIFLREGYARYSLLGNKSVSLDVALGIMPYKYSPEVRELGEFLFRSGTYPFYLLTDFDRPFARLTGLCAGFNYGNDPLDVRLDVLALTEREIRPFWDISLAAVLGVKLFKVIDIGAGIDMAHLFSVNSEVTTPETLSNHFYIYNSDSTAIVDSGYYTFRGTKVMARATVDPFGIVRGEKSVLRDIVGEHGGKIYGEIGIIGLKNYPTSEMINPHGYDNLIERMPWMVGITLPLWKILDECVFELERYPSPNPNTAAWSVVDGLPLPYYKNLTAAYDTGGAYVPRWYWSVYMKRRIFPQFSVVCQLGRDHQRWEMPMNYQTTNYDYEEAMVKPDEWGWHVKTIFNF